MTVLPLLVFTSRLVSVAYGCSGDACYNGGVCTSNEYPDPFTCACASGFDGDRCETGKNVRLKLVMA